MLCELFAARRQYLGSDDLAPQRSLEELQRRLRLGQVLAQRLQGAPIDRVAGEAAVAVVDQRLEDRRRQAVLVALLGGGQRVAEIGALLGLAGGFVEFFVGIRLAGEADDQ